jgi:hypothetical protein
MLKNKIAATKKFVEDHKVGLTVVATATPLLMLVIRNQNIFNEFLKEHDLFDEFYAMNEEI